MMENTDTGPFFTVDRPAWHDSGRLHSNTNCAVLPAVNMADNGTYSRVPFNMIDFLWKQSH